MEGFCGGLVEASASKLSENGEFSYKQLYMQLYNVLSKKMLQQTGRFEVFEVRMLLNEWSIDHWVSGIRIFLSWKAAALRLETSKEGCHIQVVTCCRLHQAGLA